MRAPILVVTLFSLLSASAPVAQESIPLPVRKVVLYKNGMGYFQHQGTTPETGVVDILLPSRQLDDILKSLTVLDLDGGSIESVTYDSPVPADRLLSDLPIDLNAAPNLVEFLAQIRGADIEIRAPSGSVTGRLLAADLRAKSSGAGQTAQVVEVSVLDSSGAVQVVDLGSAGGLRILDSDLSAEVRRYLEILDRDNRRDVRQMRIDSASRGARRLFVAYTAESPIWKSSYRIVIGEGEEPYLQGWAIVDNTSAMDWSDVELSLVSGAPISFIQRLSQPIYSQRPEVPVMAGPVAAPDIHEGALEDLRAGASEGRAAPRQGRLGLAEKSLAPPPPAAAMPMEALRREDFELDAAATGADLGDQFEYRLKDPITIGKNRSALLPIVGSDVKAEKVSLYNAGRGGKNPRLAIWLENSTDLTLDGGAFVLIDSGSFAGEGLFNTIPPRERRLLSYAIDLTTEVSTLQKSELRRIERIVINRGIMRLERKQLETRTYTIRNNAERARTVIVEHPVRSGWELVGSKPDETSSSFHRFRTSVSAQSTGRLQVQEELPQQTVYRLENLTTEQIALWLSDRSIDRQIEAELRRIVQKKEELARLEGRLAELERERQEIFSDQSRVRDNLSRLSTSGDEARLRQSYIERLSAQETRLSEIAAEQERLRGEIEVVRAQLNEMISTLSFDREL